jgi:molybdate transport system substrate-binding protein
MRTAHRNIALAGLFVAVLFAACSKETPAKAGAPTASPTPAAATELTVFAAASLRESCEEIGKLWALKHPTEKVVFNFGASNVLAQQIVASHKADVFLSADTAQLEVVRKAGAVIEAGAPGWLSNQLVVVVPASHKDVKIESATDLARPEFAKLSLANPEAVPAGKYAKAWLESKGAWKDLEARVVPALDVRAALGAVESQACDAGIVYSTDAAITEKVRVVYRVPPAEGPKIEYVAAALRSDGHPSFATADHGGLAGELLAFFTGPEARAVFERRGFLAGKVD